MCYEASDDCLAALKFILDWFIKSKILGKFHNALLVNEDILALMNVLIKDYLLLIKKHVLVVYLDKVILDNDGFDGHYPDIVMDARILAWHSNCKAIEKCEALRKKIIKKLMPVPWHPQGSWSICMSKVEKKLNRTNFYWEILLLCVRMWGYWDFLVHKDLI